MQSDTCRGELPSQCHLVNMFLLSLLTQLCQQLVTHLHQLLIATFRIHVEMEITTIHHSMRCITASEHIQHDIVRTVLLVSVSHGNIRSHSLHLIEIVHVGSHIEVSAHRYSHRFIGEMQLVEVGMEHICRHRGFDTLLVGKRIHGELSFQQRIVRIDVCPHPTVVHICRGIHSIQVILSILELLDVCLGLQVGLG